MGQGAHGGMAPLSSHSCVTQCQFVQCVKNFHIHRTVTAFKKTRVVVVACMLACLLLFKWLCVDFMGKSIGGTGNSLHGRSSSKTTVAMGQQLGPFYRHSFIMDCLPVSLCHC